MSFLEHLNYRERTYLPLEERLRTFDDGYGVEGFGGQPNASNFTPATLAGRFLWHEPSLTVDFTDAARTAPVAADGDPVGGETDQSGAGNHITQATSTKRPLFKQYTNGGETFYSTLFDGIDDGLAAVPVNGPAATNRLFVCAAVRATDLSSSWSLFHVGTETTKQAVELIVNTGTLSFDYWGAGGICKFGAMATGTYYVVSAWFDGTAFHTRQNGADVNTTPVTGIALGAATLQLGNVASSAIPWHGDCPFLVAANVVPSASDIAALERYAGSKVGVAF